MDPMTIYMVAAAGLNVGNTIFGGKSYRNSLRSQRLMNELKGAKDYNNTWRAWTEEQGLNYAVVSSSGASAEYSGSFRAITEEMDRKMTSDLDDITLMTQSMTDEFNSRLAESRRSDMFDIATTIVGTKISLDKLALNKQHQNIVKAQLERETKVKTGFPVNRKGHFTSRRDLFNYNHNVKPVNLTSYTDAYSSYNKKWNWDFRDTRSWNKMKKYRGSY